MRCVGGCRKGRQDHYRDDDADRPIRIVYSTYLNPPQDPSGSGSKCRAFSPGTLRVCLKIKWNN